VVSGEFNSVKIDSKRQRQKLKGKSKHLPRLLSQVWETFISRFKRRPQSVKNGKKKYIGICECVSVRV